MSLRRKLALLAMLSCAWYMQEVDARLQAPLQWPALHAAVASGGGGGRTLDLSGLRFHGSTDAGAMRTVLLPAGLEAGTGAVQWAAGVVLDFERTFQRSSGSWLLSIALPASSGQPSLVQLWCNACHQVGSAELVTGLIASRAVDGSSAIDAGVVVVVLDGAVLPAVEGAGAVFTASRKLQQAAGCTLTLGGQTYSFASCTAAPNTQSYTYTVYSTVVANGSNTLLRMGLVAQTNGGWAGWGLPQARGMMLGASAVIVWPTAAGAIVSGFLLPRDSYEEVDVNAAMGTFSILDSAAENVAGELRAVFTIPLPGQSANAVASPAGVNYIYAIGPMGSSSIPGLRDHAIRGRPYGGANFVMSQGPDPAGAAAQPAAESQSPPPSRNLEATSTAPPSPEAISAPPPSPAPSQNAASGSSSCTLQLAQGAALESFAGCRTIRGIGQDYNLMWKSEPVASNPAKLLVTIGMNASVGSNGYVSVGFPQRPGRMIGATAMILQTCPDGSADCVGGVKLTQWYLASEDDSGVNPSNGLAVSNVQAGMLSASGTLAGSFQLQVDAPASRRRRLLQLEGSDGSMPLIFAAGAVSSDGKPLEHVDAGSSTLPIATAAVPAGSTGAASATTDGSGHSTYINLVKSAHSWLAAIGWGVLIPAGIVMARSFKEADPLWFHLHRGMQVLGFVMGTISVGLGFLAVHGKWAAESPQHAVHRNLGVACTVLGFTQFSALVLRPNLNHKYRFAWRLWHVWVGRSAAVLAIANIYYGILHMWDLGVWTWASYTAVLGSIVGVSVVKDTATWIKSRRLTASESTAQLMQMAEQAPLSSSAGVYSSDG
ncbi:hypothetical protein D9Q98_005671 [Chlorella vulgaris]|uniref:Cytochrome b561 domain-containing protein n=1 Tax=Chlorella vulgaris TaxID=3077 RepID=A0A9D4TN54_CHLVU|nr:hypothetical protein D9Q98_005671 [Chlorella vulgaris]